MSLIYSKIIMSIAFVMSTLSFSDLGRKNHGIQRAFNISPIRIAGEA
jgi:hypothetical protein